MSEIFYQKRDTNYFDEIDIKLNKVYSKFPLNEKINLNVYNINYLKSKFYNIW